MKLHKRVMLVQAATCDISDAILKAVEKHDLTYGEIVMILGGELQSFAKYQIREERHPGDPDARGGLE